MSHQSSSWPWSAASTRSEYLAGRIVALAGASWEHNVLVANVSLAITSRIAERSCRLVTTDQKVWAPRARSFPYPDALVVRGAPSFYDEQHDVLLNPLLVLEVLSRSTEAYDRGEKFAQYRSIESLLEYVLVAQDSVQVETYFRQESGFRR